MRSIFITVLILLCLGCPWSTEVTTEVDYGSEITDSGLREMPSIPAENQMAEGDGPGGKKAMVWAEPSVRKITPDQPGRKKNYVWDGKKIQLNMARGEWESFQVVVRPLQESLSLLPKLASKSSRKLPYQRFQVAHARYIHVKTPSDLLGGKGHFPDPLIPVRKPVDLEKGKNGIFWFTVRTEVRDRPGTYKYQLQFRQGSKKLFTLPLEIKVWKVTIPVECRMRAYYLIDTPSLIQKFHNTTSSAMSKKYLDFMLQYRMYPGSLPAFNPKMEIRGNRVVFNHSQSDQWLKYILDQRKMKLLRVPFSLAPISRVAPYRSKKMEALTRSALRGLALHYKKRGWLDKNFVFIDQVSGYTPVKNISDEPYNAGKKGYDEVRYWGKLIHSAHKKLNFMVAAPPYVPTGWGSIDEHVDIYNYYVDEVDTYAEKTRELRKKGISVFLVPNSFSENIDYPGAYQRGLGYFCYKHNLDAIEQWDVFSWYPMDGVTPDPARGIVHQKFGAGAGALLYPGAGWGIDGPVSSVRLELNRDAIEDYELLRELEEVSKKKEYGRQIAQRLIPQWYKEIELDDNVVGRLRHFVLSEIVRLKKKRSFPPLKKGMVKDSRGHPLSGAAVVGKHFATTTDEKGRYALYCPSGEREISVYTLEHEAQTGKGGDHFKLKPRPSKTICSFEEGEESWDAGVSKGKKDGKPIKSFVTEKKYVTHGKRAFKLYLRKGGSGAVEFYNFSPSNWKSFRYLMIDVYNPGKNPMVIDMGLKGAQGQYREISLDLYGYRQRLTAAPQQWTTIAVSIPGMKWGGYMGFAHRKGIDVSKISFLEIGTENKKMSGPETLIFDNLRLVR